MHEIVTFESFSNKQKDSSHERYLHSHPESPTFQAPNVAFWDIQYELCAAC